MPGHYQKSEDTINQLRTGEIEFSFYNTCGRGVSHLINFKIEYRMPDSLRFRHFL